MRTNAAIYSLLITVMLLLVGCQAQRQVAEEETPLTGPSQVDPRGFDPLELPEDREVVPAKYPQTGEIIGQGSFVDTDSQMADTVRSGHQPPPDEVDSLNSQAFRVQLFTSKVYGDARRAHQVAQEIFDRPVFLDYEVPYYKLRVGNFGDRTKAEEYALRAKAAGYSDAWVVVVNVRVKGTSPLYEDLKLPQVPDTVFIDAEGDTVDDEP